MCVCVCEYMCVCVKVILMHKIFLWWEGGGVVIVVVNVFFNVEYYFNCKALEATVCGRCAREE